MSLTVDELGAFLAQPVPRDLPRGARRVALKGILSLPALLIPLGIAAFGMIFVIAFFPFRMFEELPLDLGTPAVAKGIVQNVEPTSISVNERPVYRIRWTPLSHCRHTTHLVRPDHGPASWQIFFAQG